MKRDRREPRLSNLAGQRDSPPNRDRDDVPSNEEARGLLDQLALGGKACFEGAYFEGVDKTRVRKPFVVEITGNNKWRIFEVKVPEIKATNNP